VVTQKKQTLFAGTEFRFFSTEFFLAEAPQITFCQAAFLWESRNPPFEGIFGNEISRKPRKSA
jgi:hypothetical protein